MLAEIKEMAGSSWPSLKLAFIGFCIAAVGVGVAFLIDYGPQNMALSVGCFVVVAVGVGTGFVGVVKGWRAQFTSVKGAIEAKHAARARYASRPEIQAFEPTDRGSDNSQRR